MTKRVFYDARRINIYQILILVMTGILVIFAGIEVLIQAGYIDRPLKHLFMQSISHKFSPSNPSDWFPVDPHVLPAGYYDIYKNRSEVNEHCSSIHTEHLANVITINSVIYNG